jgi:hypothetical protein
MREVEGEMGKLQLFCMLLDTEYKCVCGWVGVCGGGIYLGGLSLEFPPGADFFMKFGNVILPSFLCWRVSKG